MKGYRELLSKFQIDLSRFNPNELIVVSYDHKISQIQFTQMNHVVIPTYMNNLIRVPKRFKVGVLTQNGLNKLQYTISQLLKDERIDNLIYTPEIKNYSINWLQFFVGNTKETSGLRVVQSLIYVNVTNRLVSKWLCRQYPYSKIIYTLAISSNKLNVTKPKLK